MMPYTEETNMNEADRDWKDQMIQDQGLPEKPAYTDEPKYSLEFGFVVYATAHHGAVLLEDELWHPFRYFDDGEWDVSDEAFYKPSSAYKHAALTYT
jgi:hypothetical protein